MKKSLLATVCAVSVACGAAMSANAMIVITTDTDTVLEGFWDVTGNTGGFLFEYAVDFVPLLPGGFPEMIIDRNDTTVRFGTNGIGDPDNPFFVLDHTASFADLEFFGSYDNNSEGLTINFAFTNITDTGGPNGTFTGDFCLSADLANCGLGVEVPAPGMLGLFGLSLIGTAVSLRRRRG